MELADRFKVPLITLVDTAGAYPGIGAEERGQAEAIARSTSACLALKVPSISVVIGEGGSGGAIAIATANRVYMLEHAIYSVISPEGAASILWRDTTRSKDAATTMKITAQDLLDLQDHRRDHSRAARRRASRARNGRFGDRRPDRQDARRVRAVQRRFPRAAPREISGDRPQPLDVDLATAPHCGVFGTHFATKLPPPGVNDIGDEGQPLTLAVINFQG